MDGAKKRTRKRVADSNIASSAEKQKSSRTSTMTAESDPDTSSKEATITKDEPAQVEDQEKETTPEPGSSTGSVGKKPRKKSKKANEATASTSSVKENVSKPPKLPNRSVLQLKISLMDISPPIWRRIQVLNNDTFANLNRHIQEAMGWNSCHSHQFTVGDPKNERNILIVPGTMDCVYDFAKERGRVLKEQNTKLSKFFCAKGDVAMYEYDLGDSWMHKIVVEKILPPAPPKAEYPKCTGGKRACPPEDCGGVDGYYHLLEVYKNPQHEEYDELIKEWLADVSPGFDPEKFSHKQVWRKVWMWVQT